MKSLICGVEKIIQRNDYNNTKTGSQIQKTN